MVSSVDGLISGLSTSDLISSLMKVEAAPQDSLRAKVDKQGLKTTALQAVNAKLAGLKSAAEAMSSVDVFKTVKTTSSSGSVAASAVAGAATGQLTFDVTKLATAQVMTVSVPESGDFGDGSPLQLTIGAGSPTPIDVTTNTPQGIADAINAANVGVKAALITTDSGIRLQLTGTKTGTDNAFTLSGVNGTQNTLTDASNAQVTVGNPLTTGYTVTNQSNTFTGLIQGVSVTVSKLEAGVTIGASADSNAVADKLEAMITAANGIFSDIASRTAYNPDTKTSQPLSGNSMIRGVADAMLSSVAGGQAGYGSFKSLGVQLSKDGQLSFDREAFLKAYAADPAKVQAAVFTTGTPASVGPPAVATVLPTGLAANLLIAATTADKNITAAVTSGNSLVKDLTTQIDGWDIRLATHRAALQKQFSTLETSLSKLKNQSSWLAGQLSSLSSGSDS